MKILMVLTSHQELGNTGIKTGLWFEELAAPYYVFKDAGADITLASPAGGLPPVDPKSEEPDAQSAATERFTNDSEATEKLVHTARLDSVNGAEFDAIFYSGGHGPLWDLVNDPNSIALIEATVQAEKPLGLVCHAPSALVNAKASDGRPLVAGRKVTGFSNSEEQAVGLADVVPLSIENAFIEEGAFYEKGPDFQPFAVTDGQLGTGQNPASSELAAQAVLDLLAKR
ncbi:MAG: type 1 glutamine amidotransferase domain-containing protein [Sphaerospermopsis kisseleviana]